VLNWHGKVKWYEGSIRKMLTNEKYKGDALLQKTYAVDFLAKSGQTILAKCRSIMWKIATQLLLIKICGKRYTLRWSAGGISR